MQRSLKYTCRTAQLPATWSCVLHVARHVYVACQVYVGFLDIAQYEAARGASLLDGLCALGQLFAIRVAALQLAAKRNELTDD